MSDIGVKLTGDNSQFIAMLNSSANAAGKFSGEIASKVAGKLTGMRDVSTALAAALGINLQSIAEGIARVFTGMSKVEEEAYKQLDSLSDEHTSLVLKNMRSRLTEEQNYQLLLNDQAKLQKAVSEASATTAVQQVKLKKDQIALEKVSAEIADVERKKAEEFSKKQEKYFDQIRSAREKEFEAGLSVLTTDGKIYALKESIVITQSIISSGVLKQGELEQFNNTLIERQTQLKQEEAKQEIEVAKQRDKDAKEHVDLLKKKSQLTFEALSLEEKIWTYEESIRNLTTLINTGKKEGTDILELEVALLENAKDLAELRGVSEKAITDEIRRQSQAMEEAAASTARQAKALADLYATALSGRRGTSYEGQSETALLGVKGRLEKQIQDYERNTFGVSGGVGGKATPVEIYGLRTELANVIKELTDRRNVGDYANRWGEDAARYQYGDSLTDRAMRAMQDELTKMRVTNDQIHETMKRSPFFKP